MGGFRKENDKAGTDRRKSYTVAKPDERRRLKGLKRKGHGRDSRRRTNGSSGTAFAQEGKRGSAS